jgi:hypothetical protein
MITPSMNFLQDLATVLTIVEMCKLLAARTGHIVRMTTRAHMGATTISATTLVVSEKMRMESPIAKKIIL